MTKIGLLAAIGVLLSAAVAHAVVVDFSPGLHIGEIYRIRSNGDFVDGQTRLDNLSITTNEVRTSASGSGVASADLDGWRNDQRTASAQLRAAVGPGPGSASASISSFATFDILFPSKGDYYFEAGYGIIGDGSGLRPGETAAADWSVFFAFDPDDVEEFFGEDVVGDFNSVECPGLLCETFFDENPVPISVRVDRAIRLPVLAVIDFEISAVAVPEPATNGLILVSALVAIRLSGRAFGKKKGPFVENRDA